MDLELDPADHDLKVSDQGQLTLTPDIAHHAAQRLTIRLAMFLGEWFLDLTAGVPYFQQVLRTVPDDDALRVLFRRHIEADPYVVSVTRITTTIDRQARTLALRFEAILIEGSELALSISEGLVDGQIVVDTIGIVVNGIPVVVHT